MVRLHSAFQGHFNGSIEAIFTDFFAVEMAIPDPPTDGPEGPLTFPNFDALLAYIQAFAKDNGFAVVIVRRSNYTTKTAMRPGST